MVAMKHVFVEINFLIDLLPPLPSPDALSLFARNNRDLKLYIPWYSQSEAHRTLKDTIISADLGFTTAMMKFAVSRWVPDKSLFDKAVLDTVEELATQACADAHETLERRITDSVTAMVCIDPTPVVIARTLRVFIVKTLKPFDEMVLGAVLAKATELHEAKERDLYFCNLDSDFASKHPPLGAEYESCGLKVLPNFRVPMPSISSTA